MRRHWKLIGFALLLIFGLGLLVACGDDEEEEVVRLTAVHGSSVDFIALVPLAAWDILAERGIEVEQRYLEDGPAAIQALEQGEAQIATNIGVNVGLLAVEEGASIVDVIATQRPTWALVSVPDVPTIQDLNGKTIAVHGETSFTKAVADFYAQEFDLDMNQIIIPGSEVRAEALANGEIDASVIDLPDILRLSTVYGEDAFNVLATLGETLTNLIEQDIWLDADWAAENPDLAQEVVTAILEGIRKLRSDPAFALDLATTNLPEEDAGVLADLINQYTERDIWSPNSFLTEDNATFTLQFFFDVGEIDVDPATVELTKYFNFDYVNNALDELGRE
ncbi:MAG: ABC transporter substrate-binding protein [Anaerolineae bacterium]